MRKYLTICLLTMIVLSSSCGKDFLEVKSDVSITTPSNLKDYQALMDFQNLNNNNSYLLSLIGGDEFYLNERDWYLLPLSSNRKQQKNAYLWLDDLYEGEPSSDWNNAYQKVLYANLVLNDLENILPSPSEKEVWDRVQGTALFHRAYNFYQLAQLFCKPYNKGTAQLDLGIPLRTEYDVSIKTKRSTLEETYKRVVDDLIDAGKLLPETPLVKLRPSKISVYGLLARVYLQMNEYDLALTYAEKSLLIQNELLDYNTLDANITYPFESDNGESNNEVIFYAQTGFFTPFNRTNMHIDPELLDLYDENDQRLMVYFTEGTINNLYYRGSYSGFAACFVGLTTSELMLVRAECNARAGNINKALEDINRLGNYRYKTGTFVPYSNMNKAEILTLVFDERRRELAFRGLRWEDLRRLNANPLYAKDIVREIDGVKYFLKANSLKYTWPIPTEVINLSGIEQNER